MVLLRDLDFVEESRPEVAPAKPVVGGREVIVVVAFSGACYVDVVAADRMMATRVAVRSHVACEFERALVSATAAFRRLRSLLPLLRSLSITLQRCW
jgi:hypothetical protein